MQIGILPGEKIAQHQTKMPALCDSVFTYVVSTLVPSFLVSVWTLVPSGLVVVSTFPVLPELSRSEDEPPPKLLKPPEENPPPPEEEPPEDWA